MFFRVVVPFWSNVWESQSLQLIIAFLVSWPLIILRCISLVTTDVELFLCAPWPSIYLLWWDACSDILHISNWVFFSCWVLNIKKHIKNQRHYFANKGPYSQSYDFSSSYGWMWELDYKESIKKVDAFELCGIGEDSWESLGQQEDQTNQS